MRLAVAVSIVILTLNEAADLPGCLESIGWCDDIHLVDSGSCDGTLELAVAAGVRCYEHPFSSFGKQRNWALDHCQFAHEWILFLDADERATPAFARAIEGATAAAGASIACYYCCWKLMLDGHWLRRTDGFPRWQFRLLRWGRVRFCDFGHGQKEDRVQGQLAYLSEPYLHYAFSKGWGQWLSRHNRYSDLEAAERLRANVSWQELLARDPSVRNKALKPLLSRLPGWPLWRFLIMYVFKLGFLEGRAALTYCIHLAYYEFLIQVKMDELRRGRCLDRT